jgi:DNA-binding CsgD family transcriptional regulator
MGLGVTLSPADPQRSASQALAGRDFELGLLLSFLDETALSGGALLLSGDAGVGKTALLDAAVETALAAGTQVVRAAGTEFEADVSFSGLNQVLLPLYGEVERLSAVHRDALSVALGFGGGVAADRLVVFTAVVALLRQAAATCPLLIVVDDAHWLDRASAAALGFAARRLGGIGAGFLAGLRSDAGGFFEASGLPELKVRPLDDAAAAGLLQARFPALAPRTRQRVLAEAWGNPLALLELPGELSTPQRAARQALPATLPLSRRLQEVFAARVQGMPAAARHCLLLAVLDGTGDLGVLAGGCPQGDVLDDLAPAEQARLVHVDESARKLAFGHPLIRSAIVELSTGSERRQCHRVLAELLVDQPDRRAWHLAEASIEPDEQVAALLEQASHRILRRGDAVAAVAMLTRAADVSPPGPDRSRRLAEAAYLGADVTGELHNVSRLLAEARRAGLDSSGSLLAASAAAYLMLNGEGNIETAHRLLVGAIESWGNRHDSADSALTEACQTLLFVCLWAERPNLWVPFRAAIDRLMPQVDPVLDLQIKILADPVRTAPLALEQLDTAIEELRDEADPARIVRISIASLYIERLDGRREALWRVVRDGREGGAIAAALNALTQLCFDDVVTGQWDDALRLADEGLELGELHGYQLSAWPFRLAQALVAAARGDYDTAQDLADQMTRWAAPRGIGGVQTFARHVRTLAALGRGDFDQAYWQVTAISPAGAFTPYIAHALWVPMYLVEAAVRTGRHAEASAHVTAMRDAGIAALSPRLALLAAGSAAIAAPDHLAAGLFADALALPGADRWPFDTARVQLACGEHLRRARSTSKARVHLSAALQTFQQLGARPWAARAASELRAAGQPSPAAGQGEQALLTPQEREIALLAAAGLTNKQIAERIFVSPRTVGAHLYRIFPRLGITSRAALRDALNRNDRDAELPPLRPAQSTSRDCSARQVDVALSPVVRVHVLAVHPSDLGLCRAQSALRRPPQAVVAP